MTTSVRRTRWLRSLRRALATQELLWDRYLSGTGTSGREARAAVGEPPLRWTGRRLRGSVLPDPG
jgi:hypothetical protein